MSTLLNKPFSLWVGTERNSRRIDTFYDNIEDLKYQHKPELRIYENRWTKLKFSCKDKTSKLEMDGFDGVSLPSIVHEDGVYLEPTEKFTDVFPGDKFPLPPGLYVLTVIAEDKKYYTGFEVVPSVLDDVSVWEQMLDEVLQNIPTQAVDYKYIKRRAKEFTCNEVTPNMLWKMMILNESFPTVLVALLDITKNPHNKLLKDYAYGNAADSLTDMKAIRLNEQKSKSQNKRLVPKKIISYDLLENRFLKKILLSLIKLIDSCLTEAQKDLDIIEFDIAHPYNTDEKIKPEYLRKVKASESVKELCGSIKRLKNAINILLQAPWFNDVKAIQDKHVSGQNFSDPRYNVIYSLYKKLNRISNAYSEDRQFTMFWKQTSYLYEYWVFIKVFKQLAKLGFVLDNTNAAEQTDDIVKIKKLYKGMCFTFKHRIENRIIRISFDRKIVKANSKAKLPPIINNDPSKGDIYDKEEQPLYTIAQNNSPDCILNLYSLSDNSNALIYHGALIVDFKYRKKESFWDEYGQYKTSKTGSNHQFEAYATTYKTSFYQTHTGEVGNSSSYSINPILEVWAIYPDSKLKKAPKKILGYGGGICLIPMTPINEAIVYNKLDTFINRVFE